MEKLAYSIKEFCLLHNISRTVFYKLMNNGDGPNCMMVGRHRLVSVEEAVAWRKRMTAISKARNLYKGQDANE